MPKSVLIVRLQKLLSLSPREAGELVLALVLVFAVRAALWVLPDGTIVRVARKISEQPLQGLGGLADPARTALSVERASRFVPAATCLTQALACQILLRARGTSSELCLGVSRDATGKFRAHAWLELEGELLIGGRGSERFTRLPNLMDGGYAPSQRAT